MPNRNAFGEGPQTLSGIAGASLAGRGLSRLRLCFLAMGLALLSACTSTVSYTHLTLPTIYSV